MEFFEIIYSSAYGSLRYTLGISITIVITVFIMNYLINAGLMKKISEYLNPFTKKLGINEILTYSMLVCFFDPTVGYSLLADGIKDNKVSEKEAIGTALANSFPSNASEILTYYIAVVVPLLGIVGIYYTVIRLGISLFKTLVGLIYLKKVSKPREDIFKFKKIDRKKNVKTSFEKTFSLVKRIVPVMFITMFIVMVISEMGYLDNYNIFMEPFTEIMGISPSVGILVITNLANFSASLVLASEFLQNGVLNGKEVLIGLLFANVISFSTKYARYSLPFNISIFGAKLGTKIVIISSILAFLGDLFGILFLLFLL
ncbi:nucleoside recognition domain-containing protein [Methanococcus voltae]|uniref:Nucleoside recognition domain protein n=1 Tax=Methanococcus voltae (strain ATCC BAA-1334 / A3) TaxID=456320 RepID=D7DT72_METV3|nr:nucleoside recognition domain-containing protein [Methanococcus voltae]MCS3901182.1 hypothetical protein [Methanococcus voltae]